MLRVLADALVLEFEKDGNCAGSFFGFTGGVRFWEWDFGVCRLGLQSVVTWVEC